MQSSTRKTDDIPPSQKSNISVDNEGKISKQTDQWVTGDKNSPDQLKNGQHQHTNAANNVKNEQSDTGQKTNSPVDEPENTDKKIPQTESIKNSK